MVARPVSSVHQLGLGLAPCPSVSLCRYIGRCRVRVRLMKFGPRPSLTVPCPTPDQ